MSRSYDVKAKETQQVENDEWEYKKLEIKMMSLEESMKEEEERALEVTRQQDIMWKREADGFAGEDQKKDVVAPTSAATSTLPGTVSTSLRGLKKVGRSLSMKERDDKRKEIVKTEDKVDDINGSEDLLDDVKGRKGESPKKDLKRSVDRFGSEHLLSARTKAVVGKLTPRLRDDDKDESKKKRISDERRPRGEVEDGTKDKNEGKDKSEEKPKSSEEYKDEENSSTKDSEGAETSASTQPLVPTQSPATIATTPTRTRQTLMKSFSLKGRREISKTQAGMLEI